jgi:hypothetical protein
VFFLKIKLFSITNHFTKSLQYVFILKLQSTTLHLICIQNIDVKLGNSVVKVSDRYLVVGQEYYDLHNALGAEKNPERAIQLLAVSYF